MRESQSHFLLPQKHFFFSSKNGKGLCARARRQIPHSLKRRKKGWRERLQILREGADNDGDEHFQKTKAASPAPVKIVPETERFFFPPSFSSSFSSCFHLAHARPAKGGGGGRKHKCTSKGGGVGIASPYRQSAHISASHNSTHRFSSLLLRRRHLFPKMHCYNMPHPQFRLLCVEK